MYRIRRAHSRDAGSLSEMNYQFNKIVINPNGISTKLKKGNEIVFVATNKENPIAFICAQIFTSFCYKKPYAEITELYVKAEHRQKGVARRLIKAMESRLMKRKVNHIHILTSSSNKAARNLYEKLGYDNHRMRPEVIYDRNIKDE